MIKMRRVATLMAGALVVGVVAGSAASGWAATKAVGSGSRVATVAEPGSPAAPTAARPGAGMRLGFALRDAAASLADVVAKLTGLGVDDVRARRAAGESFAQIAQSEGVTAEEVVKEALTARAKLLDERVEAGALTREQADAALARMETRLSARVAATDPGCGGPGTGAMGRSGRGGCGGGGCGQAAPLQ